MGNMRVNMAELPAWLRLFTDIRTIIICFLVFLLISWRVRQPKNLPPGPWGWPLLGCLPNLGISLYRSGLQPPKFLANLANRYGKIYSLYLGGQLVVILNDVESVREAFQSQCFTDRPHIRLPKEIMVLAPGQGVLMGSGDSWRQQRRFTLSTFRSFGVGKRSFQDQISVEVQALSDEFSKLQGRAFDPRKLIGNAVANIICAVVFGKRFEYSDTSFHELLELLDRSVEQSGPGGATLLLPMLRYLNLSSANTKERIQRAQTLRTFYNGIIDDHRKRFDSSDLRDYIDVYLDEIKQSQGNDLTLHINNDNLRATISHLFVAGTETTVTTLRWAFLYMIANPEVQTKVQREIDAVVGRNRFPNYADKDQMPFTEATIMEVQRIASIVPLGVPHYASKDTTLLGFTIPENTIMMSNIWGVHNDPNVWRDPDVFRPERFLCDDKLAAQPDEYIPFSTGRRVCLGEDLAKMELFLFFSQLLHRFTFRKPLDSADLCFRGVIGVTHSPVGFEIEAILRDQE